MPGDINAEEDSLENLALVEREKTKRNLALRAKSKKATGTHNLRVFSTRLMSCLFTMF